MSYFRTAMRRNPTTFVCAFCAWASFHGIAILLPGNVFDIVDRFTLMKVLSDSEALWGGAMLLDGILLFVSLITSSMVFRCAVAAISAVLWMIVGALMLAASAVVGYFSAVGAFCVWGALGCLFAIEQWVNSPED